MGNANRRRRIRPFRRISLLGEGNRAWLAAQASPKRNVALKVANGSLASHELAARFRHEVELLAMLEHPR